MKTALIYHVVLPPDHHEDDWAIHEKLPHKSDDWIGIFVHDSIEGE